MPWGRREKSGIGFSVLAAAREVIFIFDRTRAVHGEKFLLSVKRPQS
jgi:hypothetical protein